MEMTYHSETLALTNMMLARLNGYKERRRRDDLLHKNVTAGSTEFLGCNDHYRLFFLLEGKILMKGGRTDRNTFYGMEFLLLPPDSEISCCACEMSRYVIVNCNELKSEGNASYFERLQAEGADDGIASYDSFPIREKLKKILNRLTVYSNNEHQDPAVYDNIFVILRSLYTEEEMRTLFSPMSGDKRKK